MFLQIIGIQCTIFIFSGNIKIKKGVNEEERKMTNFV